MTEEQKLFRTEQLEERIQGEWVLENKPSVKLTLTKPPYPSGEGDFRITDSRPILLTYRLVLEDFNDEEFSTFMVVKDNVGEFNKYSLDHLHSINGKLILISEDGKDRHEYKRQVPMGL